MKREKINAVHQHDLDRLLTSLGIYDQLIERKLRCSICGTTITKENFLCVYSHEGELQVCCERLECYQEVLKKREKASHG